MFTNIAGSQYLKLIYQFVLICILLIVLICILFIILAVNLNKYIKELSAYPALPPISLSLISTTAYFPFNPLTKGQLSVQNAHLAIFTQLLKHIEFSKGFPLP